MFVSHVASLVWWSGGGVTGPEGTQQVNLEGEDFFFLQMGKSGFFLDNFPQYSPTGNWRILEFWAKFIEFFFVEILEFFLKILEFFSKTLEFYNQGGLFNWNIEFYPSIFSFSLNINSLDRKFTSILVIMTKLLLLLFYICKKVYFKGQNFF